MSESGNDIRNLPMSSVQILDVFPVKLVAIRHPMPDEPPFTEQPTVRLGFEVGIREDQQSQAIVSAQISFEATPHPFDIEVDIAGVFRSVNPETDAETLLSQVDNTGLQILFPFLREALLDLSARLRLPPIILPLVALQGLAFARAEQTASSEQPPQRPRHSQRPRPSDLKSRPDSTNLE